MNEQELRVLLTKATEDVPASVRLMPATRAPRRRGARVLLPAIAGLGVAAVVGATVLAPWSRPSAQAEVATAVDNTSQDSFRLHTTSGAKTFDGAIDPERHLAVITNAAEGSETRFVGDLMYIRPDASALWTASPRAEAVPVDASEATALAKLATLDPVQALRRLRSATDVREEGPASGTGWTGKRFTFSLADTSAKGEPAGASGAVDVDEQGRVRRLEITFSDNGERLVTDFTDFGISVEVEAPPADQVQTKPSPEQVTKKPAKPF
ncbi:hypothetical protein [Nonomuraea sp. CA-141351]|uniref:hypothetical protein n=1 Tax=Nonomuraea sp. CA-141351 TaxID=3239996 RepID=UPI003D929068